MPRIVLQVTNGPRWCGKTRRWQKTGEHVVIEVEDPEEFSREVLLHQTHCRKIIDGEMPQRSTFFSRMRRKAASVAGHVAGRFSGQEFTTLKDLIEPSTAPDETEEHTELRCPVCEREYKTPEGLEKHLARSGHGKSE